MYDTEVDRSLEVKAKVKLSLLKQVNIVVDINWQCRKTIEKRLQGKRSLSNNGSVELNVNSSEL